MLSSSAKLDARRAARRRRCVLPFELRQKSRLRATLVERRGVGAVPARAARCCATATAARRRRPRRARRRAADENAASTCAARTPTRSRAPPTTSATATCRCRSARAGCASPPTTCSATCCAGLGATVTRATRRSSPRPARTRRAITRIRATRSTPASSTTSRRATRMPDDRIARDADAADAHALAARAPAAAREPGAADRRVQLLAGTRVGRRRRRGARRRERARWIGDVLEHVARALAKRRSLWRLLAARAAATGRVRARGTRGSRASRETAELRAETQQMGGSLARLLRDLELLDAHAATRARRAGADHAARRLTRSPRARLA